MATYYRTIAYLLRALLIIFAAVSVLIPVIWAWVGEPFPDRWWLLYVLAIPVFAVLWFASSLILQMISRSK